MKQSGVTLLELLVTLTILTILASVALPFTKEPLRFKGGAAAATLLVLVAWMTMTTAFAMVPELATAMLAQTTAEILNTAS